MQEPKKQEQTAKAESFAGQRIRSMRKQRGINIGDFAKQVGVSSGYISLIERNLIEPSLSVLRRITQALGVNLSLLLMDGFTGDFVIHSNAEARQVRFLDSNVTYWLRTPTELRNAQPQIIMVLAGVAGKSFDHEEKVSHDSEEFVHVLKGRVEYHTEIGIYTLEEGDSICVAAQLLHNIYNPAEEDAELLAVFDILPGGLREER